MRYLLLILFLFTTPSVAQEPKHHRVALESVEKVCADCDKKIVCKKCQLVWVYRMCIKKFKHERCEDCVDHKVQSPFENRLQTLRLQSYIRSKESLRPVIVHPTTKVSP